MNPKSNQTNVPETEFWGGTVKAIEKGIVPVLHIVTAALAAISLQGVIKLPGLAAWGLAIAMSLLIERLIAKVLPTTVAAGIRGYWRGNGSGLFWLMAIVSIALLVVNPFLSYKGGQQATDKLVPTFQYTNTSGIDEAQAREQERARKTYADAVANLEQQQDAVRSSLRGKYAALIAAQNSKIAGHRALAAKGHKWALSHIPACQREISRLEAKREEETAQAVQAIADKIAAQQEQAARVDTSTASQYAARRKAIQQGDELNRARWSRKYSNVSGVMFLFGVGFEIILVLCTFIIEFYFRHDERRYNAMYTGREMSALMKLLNSIMSSIIDPYYELLMLRLERIKMRFEARANATRSEREANKQLEKARGMYKEKLVQAQVSHKIAQLDQELRRQLQGLPDSFEILTAAPSVHFAAPKIALPGAAFYQPGQTVDLDPAPRKPIGFNQHQQEPEQAPAQPQNNSRDRVKAVTSLTTEVVDSDLAALAQRARKQFARIHTSATQAAREENRAKYEENRDRLKAAGAEIDEEDNRVSIRLPNIRHTEE